MGLEESEAVADAVDVDIDADGMFIEGRCEDQVGGLSADARESAEFIDCIGDLSVEFAIEDCGELAEVPRLGVVETDGEDELLDFGEG